MEYDRSMDVLGSAGFDDRDGTAKSGSVRFGSVRVGSLHFTGPSGVQACSAALGGDSRRGRGCEDAPDEGWLVEASSCIVAWGPNWALRRFPAQYEILLQSTVGRTVPFALLRKEACRPNIRCNIHHSEYALTMANASAKRSAAGTCGRTCLSLSVCREVGR
jgi:hypothetical protein